MPSLLARAYAWGRRFLPIGWRRALRRLLPVERLFGIEKPQSAARTALLTQANLVANGPDLIFLPVIPWFYRWQRPQQLASALARRGRRVFYGTLGGPGEPREAALSETGVILLPIPGIRWEDPPDRRLGGRALDEAQAAFGGYREQFGLERAALVAETPYWEPLLVDLRRRFGWKAVFDCLDDYSAFAKNRGPLLKESEDRLTAAADLVLATSRLLFEKAQRGSPNVRLLPNACDYEMFAGVGPGRPSGTALRIGYFGALEDWFDAELVAEVARRRPDWTFELVGEAEPAIRAALETRVNVRLRGERPYADLPNCLEACDVFVIPLKVTPLTNVVDPVKFYEAAAAGRPIVATPMAQLEPLAAMGLVRLAATAEDFERQIEAAAAEADEIGPRLREYARENTWRRRARDLEDAVAGLFLP